MQAGAQDSPGAQLDPRSLGALLVNSSVIALAAIRAGRIAFANPAFHAEFCAAGPLAGVALRDIVIDAYGDCLAEALTAAEFAPVTYVGVGRRGAEASFVVEIKLQSVMLDGSPLVVGFASDITERDRSKEHLAYLAYTDALTGLANRALFADRLHQAQLAARRHGGKFAVMMLDLDGFKAVNDTYGHVAGDTVLQLVARKFQHCVRQSDTLARLGGDEFGVLLPRLHAADAAAAVARRMIQVLDEPLELANHQVVIGASIGIAVYPDHAQSADCLLAAADTALYCAKRAGKHQFEWATGHLGADVRPVPQHTWSIVHTVGIREIDEQHAHLADLIDAVSAALKDGAADASLHGSLHQLIRYAGFHFATEERLMAEYRIADLVRHHDAHQRLLDDVAKLDLDGDVASISLILRYLQEWLYRHVDTMDRELAQALIAKGCS